MPTSCTTPTCSTEPRLAKNGGFCAECAARRLAAHVGPLPALSLSGFPTRHEDMDWDDLSTTLDEVLSRLDPTATYLTDTGAENFETYKGADLSVADLVSLAQMDDGAEFSVEETPSGGLVVRGYDTLTVHRVPDAFLPYLSDPEALAWALDASPEERAIGLDLVEQGMAFDDAFHMEGLPYKLSEADRSILLCVYRRLPRSSRMVSSLAPLVEGLTPEERVEDTLSLLAVFHADRCFETKTEAFRSWRKGKGAEIAALSSSQRDTLLTLMDDDSRLASKDQADLAHLVDLTRALTEA